MLYLLCMLPNTGGKILKHMGMTHKFRIFVVLRRGRQEALIGERKFLKLYGLRKKAEGESSVGITEEIHGTRQNLWEGIYISTEFNITCPVGGSLVSDLAALWTAFFRTDFEKLCSSEPSQASR